jgi:hypothetical protein
VRDEASRTTVENAVEARLLLARLGGMRALLVVTNRFHVRRALRLFRALFAVPPAADLRVAAAAAHAGAAAAVADEASDPVCALRACLFGPGSDGAPAVLADGASVGDAEVFLREWHYTEASHVEHEAQLLARLDYGRLCSHYAHRL